MAEEYFPFDSGPGADSTEARWRRMARVFAQSGVVGASGDDAYAATISGLTLTISRRAATGVAEAWVDGHMHRLVTADWAVTVPANANANPRIDRIVLRLNGITNEIKLTHVQGTPAASPVATALTQINNGIWEVPVWRFTVPANSGAPLTGLFDERVWVGPVVDAGDGRIMAYGSNTSQYDSPATEARWVGGMNLTPTLAPGRIYEYEINAGNSINPSIAANLKVRALAGATSPTPGTGTVIAGGYFVGSQTPVVATGKFTVGTAGKYTISPFVWGNGTTGASLALTSSNQPAMTVVVRDAGPSFGVPGTTPILVP